MDTFTKGGNGQPKMKMKIEKQRMWDLLSIERVSFFERLEHSNLNLTGVAIFGDGANNFYGYFGVRLGVESLYDFSKSPLSQKTDRTICNDHIRF